MENNNRLKPCPFCGNSTASFRASYNVERGIYFVFIKCEVCHARSGYSYGKENPALNNYTTPAALRSQNLWNTRPFESNDSGNGDGNQNAENGA